MVHSCWMWCNSTGLSLMRSVSMRLCMREGRTVGDGATAAWWDVAAQAGAWWDQLQCGHQLLREDNEVGEGTVLLFHCEHRVSGAFISWSGRAKTFIIGWYAWIIDMELGWQIWMDYRYESWLVGVHGSYIDTELVGKYALVIDRELD